MSKAQHHHNPEAPEFTDYTVAGTDEGRYNAARLRESNQQAEDYIRTTRSLRRMCRKSMAARNNQHQARGGFPKRRERNEDIPSKRGVPHSKFLKQFKLIYNRAEDVCKIYILHATRGWKLYA